MLIYVIGDDLTRIYGAFTTREAAEASIDEDSYFEVFEIELDEGDD